MNSNSPATKKLLVVVTAGGYTNAAPVLEIARIIASRGYTVDFATLSGREAWLKNCPFISQSHILGPAVSADIEETTYLCMSDWTKNGKQDWKAIMSTKRFLESSWPIAYKGLTSIVQDPSKRPDFILADYLVDAAYDMMVEHGIPVAMHWSQMPTAMLPAPYIPGLPGLQVDILTSEFATVWQRLRNVLVMCKALPHVKSHMRWRKRMRWEAGVSRQLPMRPKPDCLYLVNSFFGLEAAKDIPPNVAAVGPILSDSIAPLDEPYTGFLKTRSRVLYVALGTHVLLSSEVMFRLLSGAVSALTNGIIDGIIWAIRPVARKQLTPSDSVLVPDLETDESSLVKSSWGAPTISMEIESIMAGAHPSILFVEHAPQRTLLDDERIVVFLSHVGAASTNEAVYAGKPLITLPVYFDQIQYGMRLRDAGVSVPLNKDDFTSEDVSDALAHIIHDKERGGQISINTARMREIARLASRRKHLAADLIEEMLADSEARRKESMLLGQKRPRGFHLETADGRMSAWKAKNWDLWAIGCAAAVGVLGIVVALPVALALIL
ncbi:putative UDP-glucosyl transferase family protein [Seiridium unicorne]|uniref:UDP-glucosyl transferase family protein n=1 Tax=Seiridium unicorne TaxID=138068 RepID=A0ABR2UIR2_9PEZI